MCVLQELVYTTTKLISDICSSWSWSWWIIMSTLSRLAGLRRMSDREFAPASCCVDVQVYVSMWITLADPVMRRRDSDLPGDRRAIWPNNAHLHFAMWSIMGERSVRDATLSFQMWSCQRTPRIRRWHRIWKASRVLTSAASRVHVSAVYNRTEFNVQREALVIVETIWLGLR